MSNTKLLGLILNLILYIITIIPIIALIFNKKIYKNKKTLVTYIIFITIIETLLSFFIYCFSKNIFYLFSSTLGIVNYATYASRIIFISSPLYGTKFLIPAYLIYTFPQKRKKTTILFISKIAVTALFIFISQKLFLIKNTLYSFPICDFIYNTIYIILFIKSSNNHNKINDINIKKTKL